MMPLEMVKSDPVNLAAMSFTPEGFEVSSNCIQIEMHITRFEGYRCSWPDKLWWSMCKNELIGTDFSLKKWPKDILENTS